MGGGGGGGGDRLSYQFPVLSHFQTSPFFPLLSIYLSTPSLFVQPEHKNMPLEDALSLVSKDFDHYMLSGRPAMGPRRSAPLPAPAPDVSHLLGKAASGASLSSSELSAVISALQKQRQDDDMASSSSHNGAIYSGKLNYTLGMDK